MQTGGRSAFLAVETLYSMDGTVCPLAEMVEVMEELLPCGNGYVVVDEAHATGIYGPQGRGLVALLGLEDRVLARLHTFGKALAGTGGAHAAQLVRFITDTKQPSSSPRPWSGTTSSTTHARSSTRPPSATRTSSPSTAPSTSSKMAPPRSWQANSPATTRTSSPSSARTSCASPYPSSRSPRTSRTRPARPRPCTARCPPRSSPSSPRTRARSLPTSVREA